jgi:hypothetical protein
MRGIATGFPLLPPVVILRLLRQQPRLVPELEEGVKLVDGSLAEHVMVLKQRQKVVVDMSKLIRSNPLQCSPGRKLTSF